jgi:hypothetical protein
MALIDDVRTLLLRLWGHPGATWSPLLAAHGWNRTAAQIAGLTDRALRGELTDLPLGVDRSRPGFADFAPHASRLVAPARPGKSLLYHALASADVHPSAHGRPVADPTAYPTLAELDTVENFIYATAADRTDLDDTFVAVFAYQYRPARRASHRVHADLAYSRTGVARVGTAPAHYDPSRRSFWVLPEDGGDRIAVMPARFGAFLARRGRADRGGSVQGRATRDDYVFPVHKLFDGRECLAGRSVRVRFHEYHRNEKLLRIHQLTGQGGIDVAPGFDATAYPFVRDSRNDPKLVRLDRVGDSVLLKPVAHETLVRTVVQHNRATDRVQTVHFRVPPARTVRRRSTRFESTLEIPSFGDVRLAPEYVNIRHEVETTASPSATPRDLNQLASPAFEETISKGGYLAAHFTDETCDGCVAAEVDGVAASSEDRPAYSLVTAPDFFPLADQLEMAQQRGIGNAAPLSFGRHLINSAIPLPSSPTTSAFRHGDLTVTAVVGDLAEGPTTPVLGGPNRLTSFLPDAASDVFAPGWDVSLTRGPLGDMLAAFGLGSPFPEDAKLCAALSSFWPAVAPDAARTFGNLGFESQLPMFDEELGLHPRHEDVRHGIAKSHRGWDGEYGPFFETVDGARFVNHAAIARVDYVSNALAGHVHVSLTAEVQTSDLLARARALKLCEQLLGRQRPRTRPDCLVTARRVGEWAATTPAHPELRGPGFLYVFAKLGPPQPSDELSRVRRPVHETYTCRVADNGIALQRDTAPFTFVAFG